MIWHTDAGPRRAQISLHIKNYFITVDYYSNFWEIDYLPDKRSVTVIRKLKAHFSQQGIPDVVISDNGR